MGGFLLRKVGAALIVLLLASMLVFLGVRALPGDPAIALGAENRDPAVLEAIRHHYGLDQPSGAVREVARLASARRPRRDQRELPVAHTIVSGCRSRSSSRSSRSSSAIADRDPRRDHRGGPARQAERLRGDGGALVGLSVPHFWLGLMMIIFFAVDLHWLPAERLRARSGRTRSRTSSNGDARDRPRHRALGGPDAADALVDADSLGADYVRTARAKGLSRALRRRQARAAQQPDHGDDDHRPPARRPHLRGRRSRSRSSSSPASAG